MTARRPGLPARLLVTGASGKLRTVVCHRLAMAGVSVVAFDRAAPASPAQAEVTPVRDLTDPRPPQVGGTGDSHL